jgi:protein-S-isoprenylcysteine O-methyltransferase Ste14
MNNDAVSFVLLCVVTRETVRPVMAEPVAMAGAVLLVALGVSMKLWAAKQLGSGAYYWQDFFTAVDAVVPEGSGPYRFLKNPMYTVGYLHAYGVALLCGSLPGLMAAAFDQAAILVFWRLVEKPHLEFLTKTPSQ